MIKNDDWEQAMFGDDEDEDEELELQSQNQNIEEEYDDEDEEDEDDFSDIDELFNEPDEKFSSFKSKKPKVIKEPTVVLTDTQDEDEIEDEEEVEEILEKGFGKNKLDYKKLKSVISKNSTQTEIDILEFKKAKRTVKNAEAKIRKQISQYNAVYRNIQSKISSYNTYKNLIELELSKLQFDTTLTAAQKIHQTELLMNQNDQKYNEIVKLSQAMEKLRLESEEIVDHNKEIIEQIRDEYNLGN